MSFILRLFKFLKTNFNTNYNTFISGVTIQGGTDTPLGCIRIKRVIISSPAAAAGIIPNDILLSVEGKSFLNYI